MTTTALDQQTLTITKAEAGDLYYSLTTVIARCKSNSYDEKFSHESRKDYADDAVRLKALRDRISPLCDWR